MEIRLYDEGMAYRMLTNRKGELTIFDEAADFVFAPSSTVFFQQDSNMNSDYEAPYVEQKDSRYKTRRYGKLSGFGKDSIGYKHTFCWNLICRIILVCGLKKGARI